MEEKKKEESKQEEHMIKNNKEKKEVVVDPVTTQLEEKKEDIAPPKKEKLNTKHAWTIAGISLGALIVFIIGVMLFLPQVFLALTKNKSIPDTFSTETVVTVGRSVDIPATDEAPADSFVDSIELKTDTDYIAPRTWRYTTVVTDTNGANQEGIEVLIFATEAYQRPTGGDQDFVMYPLEDEDYTTTEEAISASSLFIPQLLEYAGAQRFVWNTNGQPWWYLHYRMPIDVARIEADQPEWYDPQLYPFAYEEGLGDQEVTFVLDVWVHPFTGRVMHEVWSINKKSIGDEALNVALDIVLVRGYDLSGDFTIDKP